jgi:hypothetical protein
MHALACCRVLLPCCHVLLPCCHVLLPCCHVLLLCRLLAEGTSGAFCSAAEALTQIATTSDVRCRLIVRACALPHLKPMLQAHSSPINVLWASRLLKALVQVSIAPNV